MQNAKSNGKRNVIFCHLTLHFDFCVLTFQSISSGTF